jgi:hypothetical protein
VLPRRQDADESNQCLARGQGGSDRATGLFHRSNYQKILIIKVMPKKEKKVIEKKEKKVEGFVVKKYTLLKIADWLSNIIRNPGSENESKIPFALHGPDSRSRNKIHRIIVERAKEVEDQRMELVKKHAKKNDNDEPMFDEATGKFDIIDMVKFNEEFLVLMNEESVFDILPSNSQDWRIVKDIFLNRLKSEMTVEDTIVYEEVCQAFEAI